MHLFFRACVLASYSQLHLQSELVLEVPNLYTKLSWHEDLVALSVTVNQRQHGPHHSQSLEKGEEDCIQVALMMYATTTVCKRMVGTHGGRLTNRPRESVLIAPENATVQQAS